EKIGVGIFDFDAYWESLRHADPVQFALHVRNSRRRQIDLAFGLNCPTDSLHSATEALVRRRREIDNRLASRRHMLNLGFEKIRDHIPFAGVEQGEDRNTSGYMGAGRKVQVDDSSGKRGNDLAVRDM